MPFKLYLLYLVCETKNMYSFQLYYREIDINDNISDVLIIIIRAVILKLINKKKVS